MFFLPKAIEQSYTTLRGLLCRSCWNREFTSFHLLVLAEVLNSAFCDLEWMRLKLGGLTCTFKEVVLILFLPYFMTCILIAGVAVRSLSIELLTCSTYLCGVSKLEVHLESCSNSSAVRMM